jgi:hypothetical protein
MNMTRTLLTASLALSIACDDADRTDVDSTDINSARQSEPTSPALALRAVQLVKATRVTSAVVRNNPLSPTEAAIDCVSVQASDIEELNSDCDVMPDTGYIVSLQGCELENGETFDAELLISTPDVESGDVNGANGGVDPTLVLAVAPVWMVNTQIQMANGTELSTCGIVDRQPIQTHEEYVMSVETHGQTTATFEVISEGTLGNEGMVGRRDTITRLDTSNPSQEVGRLLVQSRSEYSRYAMPSRGVVELTESGGQRVHFFPRLTQTDRVMWIPHRSEMQALNVSEL